MGIPKAGTPSIRPLFVHGQPVTRLLQDVIYRWPYLHSELLLKDPTLHSTGGVWAGALVRCPG